MKIAIVGKGKTGQAVIDSLPSENISAIFHSTKPITIEDLDQADAIIIFVNAEVLHQLLPVLLQIKTPIICGTTGYLWSEEFIREIDELGHTWIVANNFSFSMALIKSMLNTLSKLPLLNEQVSFKLQETHHLNKIDIPSGTALLWKSWLGLDYCPIESIRKKDVKGEHHLVVENIHETIELKHIANDRKLFAQGAIWAAKYTYEKKDFVGFHQFDELVRRILC